MRENFIRPTMPPPPATRSARFRRRREVIGNFLSGLPVLLVIGFGAYVQTFDPPFLSLYIDQLFRQGPEATGLSDAAITSRVYGITGSLTVLSTIGAMLGSIFAGIVMDRRMPPWSWSLTAIMSGAGAAWIFFAPSLAIFALGRGLYQLFLSALASVLIVVLSRMTPSPRRGVALGWSVTVRSIGWILAQLSGAASGTFLGLRESYGVIALLNLLQAPMFLYLARRYRFAFHPDAEDPSSFDPIGESAIATPSGHGKPA